MAESFVAPTNKPVAQFGGVKKKPPMKSSSVVPSPAAEAAGAVGKAKAMLKRGLISQDQHDQLAAKAAKVASFAKPGAVSGL